MKGGGGACDLSWPASRFKKCGEGIHAARASLSGAKLGQRPYLRICSRMRVRTQIGLSCRTACNPQHLFIQLSAQKKSWRQEAKLVNVSSHVSHDTKQLMALSSFDHGVSAFNSVLRLALGRPEGHIRMTEMSFSRYQLKKECMVPRGHHGWLRK